MNRRATDSQPIKLSAVSFGYRSTLHDERNRPTCETILSLRLKVEAQQFTFCQRLRTEPEKSFLLLLLIFLLLLCSVFSCCFGTARLVLRLDHRAHIKPALQRLHWLPAKARIQFKIATVMHATLNQRGPAYLNNIIKFNTEESGRRQLRFSTTNAAVIMRTRTQFWKRAFSVCGPSIWNQISPHIRTEEPTFCSSKALKTYLFLQMI